MVRSCVGLACALICLAGCSPGHESGARSVLLITLDTTRADALSCYGGRPGVTPALDALAQRAVLYESAYSVAPMTFPAHASMMTGLYPFRHTVRGNGSVPLPESAQTLAERARAAGYQTAAFVSAIVLDRVWGLDQGFDVYDQPPINPGGASLIHMLDRRAHDTLHLVQEWLAKRDPDRPFFLWVHFFDPHSPCEPPKRFLDQARGTPYLGEVAAMDNAIGALLEDLRRAGADDSTLVCVAADHGEGQGEHGEYTHSSFCYQGTIRVPLLIAHPDGWRAGERSSEIVSLVDVEPTLAEAMGLPIQASIDGQSLFRRTVEPSRGVFLESFYGYMNFGWNPIVGWVDRAGKYLCSGREELYRLDTDPREAHDQSAVAADEIARYRAAIAQLAQRPVLATSATVRVDEAARDLLQKLGYAGAPVSTLALPALLEETGLPVGMDRVEEMHQFQYAVAAGAAGMVDTSLEIFEEIARANPRHAAALSHLGGIQLDRKRCSDAEATLEHLEKLGAAETRMHGALSRCFEDEKNILAALEHMQRAQELKPDNALILEELARLFALAGQPERAQEAQRAAQTLRQVGTGSN